MRKALQAEQGKADMERKVSACHHLIFGEYILRKKSVFCFMWLWRCRGSFHVAQECICGSIVFFFSHSQLSPFCYCAFKRKLNEIALDHCSCITWEHQIKYCCFNKHLLEYKVIVMVSCRFKSLRETSEILRDRSMNWKPSVKPLRREKLKEGQSRKRSMQRKFSFSRGPTNNWRYILSLLKGSLP